MNASRDLLIEIGTEDLPARLLSDLSSGLGEQLCKQLSAQGLAFKNPALFCTPRRLAMVIPALDERQKDQFTERKGPRISAAFDQNGKATQAAMGFARSCGVAVEQLEINDDPDHPRLLYREKSIGKQTSALLPELIAEALKKLPMPKRMRWNHSNAEFIRPIRWLLLMFGSEVIPANLFGVTSANISYGHRFLAPQALSVKHPTDYKHLLETKGYVLADFEQRQKTIITQVNELACQVDGTPSYSQKLLDEITGLVEWPSCMLGEFDRRFLEVHKELLIGTMQDNQKYIPLLDKNGALLATFVIVSNMISSHPEVVKRGNEKVIVPRFEDAMFFWQRDKAIVLEQNLAKLEQVVYEKKLGSLKDKTDRMIALAEYLCEFLHADRHNCQQAAKLCKCDLVTETVAEFPSLQGVVGRNLAMLSAENKHVCVAIEEHYLPKHAKGALPVTPVGITLALADRIDTLVGSFAIGKKPTGLKDPYGLRRAAFAILRIVIETPLELNLPDSLRKSASLFPAALRADQAVEDLSEYINERYRAYFSDGGVPADVVDAVLANHPAHPGEVAAKVDALMQFRDWPHAQALAAANKRIRNILKKTARRDAVKIEHEFLVASAEQRLHAALENLSSEIERSFSEHDYQQALTALAQLHQPVNEFFDEVVVMDENEKLRTNRIALLSKIDAWFMHIADFSKLQSKGYS